MAADQSALHSRGPRKARGVPDLLALGRRKAPKDESGVRGRGLEQRERRRDKSQAKKPPGLFFGADGGARPKRAPNLGNGVFEVPQFDFDAQSATAAFEAVPGPNRAQSAAAESPRVSLRLGEARAGVFGLAKPQKRIARSGRGEAARANRPDPGQSAAGRGVL